MISSTDNKKILEVSKLYIPKYQNESGRFLVEGEHLVNEAFNAGLLESVFAIEDVNYDVPMTIVAPSVMKKMTTLDSIPSVIGVCRKKEENDIRGNVLILDGIQDPGNLGTIIRSAVAFNIDTIVLSSDTVNMYNAKVLRATQGMIFHINIIKRDLNSFIPNLKNFGYRIYSTNVEAGTDIKNVNKASKYAIIMGSEGSGVKPEINLLSDEALYIKTSDKCESLNVGVATSIILYELSR